jgi:hypothetical protein
MLFLIIGRRCIILHRCVRLCCQWCVLLQCVSCLLLRVASRILFLSEGGFLLVAALLAGTSGQDTSFSSVSFVSFFLPSGASPFSADKESSFFSSRRTSPLRSSFLLSSGVSKGEESCFFFSFSGGVDISAVVASDNSFSFLSVLMSNRWGDNMNKSSCDRLLLLASSAQVAQRDTLSLSYVLELRRDASQTFASLQRRITSQHHRQLPGPPYIEQDNHRYVRKPQDSDSTR